MTRNNFDCYRHYINAADAVFAVAASAVVIATAAATDPAVLHLLFHAGDFI